MKIKLYNSTCEKIVVDKSNYLTNETIIEGGLKEACSINTPSLLIDSRTFQTSISLFNYNYLYIEEFNRYYFIGEISSENTYLWRITCIEDTLFTYKDKIKSLTAYVLRNENTYDEMQQDTIPVKSGYDIDEVVISDSTYEKTVSGLIKTVFNSAPTFANDENNFIMFAMNTSASATNTEIVTPQGLPSNICPNNKGGLLGITCSTSNYLLNYARLSAIANIIVNDDTLASYVISIVSYPFVIPSDNTPAPVKIGSIQTAVPAPHAVTTQSNYLVLNYFNYGGSGTFLDYDPYTTYNIYLPYYGWTQLNAEDILGNDLAIVYIPDYQTGTATVEIVKCGNKPYTVFSATCQLGSSVPLNTTNALETQNQRSAIAQQTELTTLSNKLTKSKATTNASIGLASGASKTAAGIATWDAKMAIDGATQVAQQTSNLVYTAKEYSLAEKSNLVNAQIQYDQVYDTANCTVVSGNFGLYGPQKAILKIVKQRLALDPNSASFKRLQGRVLNQYVQLSTLTGFTQISAVHLENFGQANLTELNTLDSLLKSGIIL